MSIEFLMIFHKQTLPEMLFALKFYLVKFIFFFRTHNHLEVG